MYTQPKQVLQALDARIDASAFDTHVLLYVVTGYPRSDIGKGTLVAHLLGLLPDTNIVKFDGMINSNLDGRFTSRHHDDFATYTAHNPEREWQPANHLLGGDLLTRFVAEYGDTDEVLSFRPYLVKYFIARLQESWRALGRPDRLVLELGGVPDDPEVEAFAIPAVQAIRARLGSRCQIILLTELAHNSTFVKTKTARDAVRVLTSRGLSPDVILVREPASVDDVALSERIDFERRVRDKLLEHTGATYSKILAIPHYRPTELGQYGDYLALNLLPYLLPAQRHDRLLIGSTNPNKIRDWINELGTHLNVVTPDELGLTIDVPEGLVSVRENSMAKAKAYCRASGLPTVADDIGFFVHALNGQPGVAVRRWGGQLPHDTTDEEFFVHLARMVSGLTDTSAHFERTVSIAVPNGEDHQFTYTTQGHLDLDLLAQGFVPGEHPLASIFTHAGPGVTWSELDDAERAHSRTAVVDAVVSILRKHLPVKA